MLGLTHYVEISFSRHINPTGFAARVIGHVHAYKSRHDRQDLALDFPCWQLPRSFMRAQLGHVIRLLGSEDTLSHFLRNTTLTAEILSEGIAMHGIRAIPGTIAGYVSIRRNHRIGKIEKLLKNPEQIQPEKCSHAPTEHALEMASEWGLAPTQVAAFEHLHKQHLQELKQTVEVRLNSQSTRKTFRLCLERNVHETDLVETSFSSYGLCLERSAIPTW